MLRKWFRKIFPEKPLVIDDDPIHYWFELSYAQYVALPRSILQNMPVEWQRKFVALMDELDERFDWRRGGCRVRFVDRRGRYMSGDDLGDYERGRRHLTPEEVSALVAAHNKRFRRE